MPAFLCVAYLTIKLGKLEVIGGDNYPVLARFKDVTGLKSGAYVEMSGVRIGRVSKIAWTPRTTWPWSPSTSTRAYA